MTRQPAQREGANDPVQLWDFAREVPVWRPTTRVLVRGAVGHPQGLTSWGENWLISTVHIADRLGELLIVERTSGEVLDRYYVTDGERYHPGGITATGSTALVPVAEYRPASTTRVYRVNGHLETTTAFIFDDHLGLIAELPDSTLLAASWGSRMLYRLDGAGHVLDARANGTHYVDFQDVSVVDGQHVVLTGVGRVQHIDGSVQIGGMAVLNVDSLVVEWEAPVAVWTPGGRVATYNGTHIDIGGDLRLHAIADDDTATIDTWTAADPKL